MKTLIFAAFAASLLVAPAAAQSPDSGRVQTIAYADLDLGTAGGRAALDRRIRAAIDELCGTPSSADPNGRAKVEACRSEALADAASQRDRLVEARGATLLAAQR